MSDNLTFEAEIDSRSFEQRLGEIQELLTQLKRDADAVGEYADEKRADVALVVQDSMLMIEMVANILGQEVGLAAQTAIRMIEMSAMAYRRISAMYATNPWTAALAVSMYAASMITLAYGVQEINEQQAFTMKQLEGFQISARLAMRFS